MFNYQTKFVVLDFQWFYLNRDNLIPKELASCDSDNRKSHFVFKPVVSFGSISAKDQRVARYVSSIHTGLKWEDGYTHSSEFDNIIRRLCRNVDVVYVKGREKVEFLQNIVDKRIVDLSGAKKITKGVPHCCFHIGNSVVCALSNVENLYNYLKFYYKPIGYM